MVWTATDGSGNTATCSYDVVVKDEQLPTITCATPDASYPANNGVCTYTVPGTALDPTFADNCTGESVKNNFNNTASLKDAIFPLGKTTVVWTATDGSGNTATCSYDVVVKDEQLPTITCATPDASYPANNGVCTYTVPGTALDPTFADNCTGESVKNNFNNTASLKDAIFPLGKTTVVWTATDGSGNTATCSYDVVVKDEQLPTITCATPDASYPANNGVCTYTVPGTALDPTFADNCTGESVKNNFNNTASLKDAIFPLGKTTVVWTATDGSGNTATCSYDVVVKDEQLPTITCATPDASYPANNGVCTYTVPGTALDPTFADNCTGESVKNNFNNTASLKDAIFPLGKNHSGLDCNRRQWQYGHMQL